MSHEYTKATLKEKLVAQVDSANDEFIEQLDDIVQLGEARLAKMLDLEQLDGVDTVLTTIGSAEITKPANLIVERFVEIENDTGKSPVLQHSRAWISAYNIDGETGTPKYYCDYDSDRWSLAPIPGDELMVTVHGLYRPVSIIDGGEDDTTWFSTRVPELLLLACIVEACEFLKFWSKKAAAEADLNAQAQAFLLRAPALRRADVVSQVLGRKPDDVPTE